MLTNQEIDDEWVLVSHQIMVTVTYTMYNIHVDEIENGNYLNSSELNIAVSNRASLYRDALHLKSLYFTNEISITFPVPMPTEENLQTPSLAVTNKIFTAT